ncbi:MAG TPA: GAF domain-containing protein [Kofleriaceae bacterium]|nr:GAF domain-containing protein [Kofleriaceae bacterium]
MPPDHAVHIHHAGDARVDGILRLIEIAGEDTPLAPRLSAMCDEIATMTGVDVVSVYVREADDETLVMRGNHGFAPSAIGTVRLAVGEGLTGLCAACLRPVSVAVAAHEVGFKLVPGLGEERFPAYVGVPLLGGGRAIGVLVLQRAEARAFSAAEVALATALGAPVTLALERRSEDEPAPRSARLDGDVVVSGASVARASILPTLASLETRKPIDIMRGLDLIPEELDRAIKRIRKSGDAAAIRAVAELELLWLDARLRERLAAAPATVTGLYAVAREYARAPFRIAAMTGSGPGADASTERAEEIEDLLAMAWTLAADGPLYPHGGLWVGDRVGGLVSLLAAARDAGALVSAGAPTAGALAINRVEERPLLANVRGLHAWIRNGDRCAVDAPQAAASGGDRRAGTLWVNPPASAIERARARRSTP